MTVSVGALQPEPSTAALHIVALLLQFGEGRNLPKGVVVRGLQTQRLITEPGH